jgi:hypothetical protein
MEGCEMQTLILKVAKPGGTVVDPDQVEKK